MLRVVPARSWPVLPTRCGSSRWDGKDIEVAVGNFGGGSWSIPAARLLVTSPAIGALAIGPATVVAVFPAIVAATAVVAISSTVGATTPATFVVAPAFPVGVISTAVLASLPLAFVVVVVALPPAMSVVRSPVEMVEGEGATASTWMSLVNPGQERPLGSIGQVAI